MTQLNFVVSGSKFTQSFSSNVGGIVVVILQVFGAPNFRSANF